MKSLTGRVFGRLKVLRLYGTDRNGAIYVCQCECGKILNVRGAHLRSGNTKSCGCLRRDNTFGR
jgi:hypothetical protein